MAVSNALFGLPRRLHTGVAKLGHQRPALVVVLALGCAGTRAAVTPGKEASAPVGNGQPPTEEANRATHSDGAIGEPQPAAEPKAESVFFSALPLEASPNVEEAALVAEDNVSFARSLRVRMHVMRGYQDLGELTRRSKLPLVNGVFQMSDLSHLHSTDRPGKGERSSSFVVDFDEPDIDGPAKALAAQHPSAKAEDIARFVSDYIQDKSYQRAFDVASRVARSKTGDCTEHAVLTAALLRKTKIPARVLLGVVLLAVSRPNKKPQLMAVGHSWVEYYENRSWKIVDAALRPDDDTSRPRTGAPGVEAEARVRIAYLPITIIKDESVSFARSLMDQVGVESVVRVELDAAPPAEK